VRGWRRGVREYDGARTGMDFGLSPKAGLTLAAGEEVDDGADGGNKDDHKNPDDFFRALEALVLQAINEHPDPENEGE